MELESVSKSFVYATLVYLVILAYGLNFLLRNIKLAFMFDFWIVFLIVLLPLFLIILYFKKGDIEFVYNHQSLFRYLIVFFVIVAAVFVSIFIIPISY